MPNTEEQRLDIIENCRYFLDGVLSSFEQTDATPEGRMITQLKWLLERAENHDLLLPVDPVKLSTLRYVYTEGELCRHASNPGDRSIVDKEIENPLERILNITKKGALLYKPEYEPYVTRCIDALIRVLQNASRPMDKFEIGFIQELQQIKKRFSEKNIVLPVGGCNEYPNLIEAEDSIIDIPRAKTYFRMFYDLVFNGIRPDAWVTPDDADKDTAGL